MGQDQHPLPLGDCAFNNVAGDDGLTAASGQYVERALPDLDGGFELFDSFDDSPEARS